MSVHIRKVGTVFAVGAIGLALLGAGCRNPFRKKPENVFSQAYSQLLSTESVRTETRIALDIDAPVQGGKRERGHIEAQAIVDSVSRANGDRRSDTKFTLALDMQEGAGTLTLLLRAIGDVQYLQIQDAAVTVRGKDATQQAQMDMVIGMVKGVLAGKWIRVDQQSVAGLLKQLGGQEITIPSEGQTKTMRDEINAALRAHPFFTVRADLGDVKVNGVSAYHYRVGIDRAGLVAAIPAILRAVGAPERDPDSIRRAFDDAGITAMIDGAAGEAWIAKKSMTFVRWAFPIAVTRPDGNATGELSVDFSQWGKPAAIEAPTDVKTIDEILGGLLGGGLAPGESPDALDLPPNVGGPLTGLEPNVDADADGLSNTDETRYGTNPAVSDTDGDGFNDGDEVRKGYNPNGPGRLP